MSNHVNNGDCHVNYEGSSPAMEDEAAVVFWQRSIEKHKMRYRYMVSDGDSKRMGKHLLKLKSNTKGKLDDGKTIGGKERTIDRSED